MFCKHFLFKLVAVEWPRFAAFLGLDERRADRFEIGLAGLVAAYQIADIFAIVGEFPSGNPRLDPAILLVGNGARLARRSHNIAASNIEMYLSYYCYKLAYY